MGSGARNAASSPGGTTTSPSGLRRSEATFATSLVAATPTEAVEPDLVPDRDPDLPRDLRAVAEQGPGRGDVQERLVDRDGLDLGREPAEDRHDLAARLLVPAPVHGQEHALGAQAAGGPERHRGMHPERAGLVAGRGDDAPLVGSAAADDDRPAAKLGPVALLDRREERVEVHVQDGPAAHVRDSPPVACRRPVTCPCPRPVTCPCPRPVTVRTGRVPLPPRGAATAGPVPHV